MKNKWLLLLLIPIGVLCLVFPPLFILISIGIALLVGVADVGLLRLLGLVKKCAICRKLKISASDANTRAYNKYLDYIPSYGGKTMGCVCDSCLERVRSHIKCDNCHESFGDDVHGSFIDADANSNYVKKTLDGLGRANSADWRLLCQECKREIVQSAFSSFYESIKDSDIAQPILLDHPKVRDAIHCARCGKSVLTMKTNFAQQLKFLYSDDAYPYSDLRDECRSVINDYLNSEVICSSCCWQLRPEHVRADYLFRSGDGWIGGVKGSEVPGYCVTHRFGTVAYSKEDCRSIDAVKDKLRKKALLEGANGFIEFWYDIRSGRYYTGHAVPVTFERVDKVESHGGKAVPQSTNDDSACPQRQTPIIIPDKIIIDGSNLIREKGGSSVNGLLACIEALKRKGCQVQVLLDANILHVLRENGDVEGACRLEDLLTHRPDCAKIVPAGARADDFILIRANDDGSHIVSNDRFNQYVERYPWLKEQRLHKFMFMDGRLMIPDLGVDILVGR